MAKYLTVASEGGCVKQYDSDNNAWVVRVSDGSTSNTNLYEVHGKDDYIMACGIDSSSDRAVIVSQDNGVTWEDAIDGLPDSGYSQYARAIHVVNKREAYCYCTSGNDVPKGIFKWDGGTWRILIDERSQPAGDTREITKRGDYLYFLRQGGVGEYLYRFDGTSIEQDSSLPNLPSLKYYRSMCFDSNDNIYIFEKRPIGENDVNLNVYYGKFGSLSLLRSNSNSHYSIWGDGKFAWVSNRDNLYYIYQTYVYYSPTLYVAKRINSTGDWVDVTLCAKAGYGIFGKNDNDIMILSASTDGTWDGGPGYCQHWDGATWSTVQHSGFTWAADARGTIESVWTEPDEITEDIMTTEKKPGYSFVRKIASGDIALDDHGEIYRDYSIESRCTFRLTCRRGEYWADPTLGSRLHTIKTLKDAKKKTLVFSIEALKPMFTEGSITNVLTGEFYEDPYNGALAAQILVETPSSTQPVDLGLIPIGGR